MTGIYSPFPVMRFCMLVAVVVVVVSTGILSDQFPQPQEISQLTRVDHRRWCDAPVSRAICNTERGGVLSTGCYAAPQRHAKGHSRVIESNEGWNGPPDPELRKQKKPNMSRRKICSLSGVARQQQQQQQGATVVRRCSVLLVSFSEGTMPTISRERPTLGKYFTASKNVVRDGTYTERGQGIPPACVNICAGTMLAECYHFSGVLCCNV